ncbi:MAG: YihY/virulence factor BrkB family protein [Desulfonauticus sp.]|nr:YihY/virulence factor BrkB family protein [Desulfonauticus sp.]
MSYLASLMSFKIKTNKLLDQFKKTVKLIALGGKYFLLHQGFLFSAGLTFYALLSFIPLIGLLISLAGIFLHDTVIIQQFLQNKLAILPWAKDIVLTQLNYFLASAPKFSGLSFVFILWTSGLFFSALQSCFYVIYQKKPQKYYWHIPLPWLLGPFLGFGLFILMFVGQIIKHIPSKYLPNLDPDMWTWLGTGMLIFILFQFLSAKRPSWRVSIVTALVISLISEGITQFFSHILWYQPNYSLVYGTLSSLILFLLWLNANMVMILWGAYFLFFWDQTYGSKKQSNP